MTERNQVNNIARNNLAPYGLWLRCEHAFAEGWSDVFYILCKCPGWLECKLIPGSPFTREQLLFGEDIVRAGGRWHLLAKRGRTWILMNIEQARAWYEGAEPHGVVECEGKFPTIAILKELIK